MSKNDDNEEMYGGESFTSIELIDFLEATPKKWRRAVLKSFIADSLWKTKIENKLKRLTRENIAIIGLLTGLIAIAIRNTFFG